MSPSYFFIIPLTVYLILVFGDKNSFVGKISDFIILVGEIILYSLFLPIAVGFGWLLIGAVSDLLDVLYYAALENRRIFLLISVMVGILMKLWTKYKDKSINL